MCIVDSDLQRADAELRSRQFAEAVTWLMRTPQSAFAAAKVAEQRLGRAHRTVTVLKAIAAAATSDTADLAPLRDLGQGFSSALQGESIFDAVLAAAHPGQPHAQFLVLTGRPGASKSTEGKARPIRRGLLARDSLRERETSSYIVLSDEAVRHASAFQVVETAMRQSVALEHNRDFLGDISAGATSLPALGSDAAGIRNDIKSAGTLLPTSTQSTLFLALPASVAKRLALLSDGAGEAAFPRLNLQGGQIGNAVTAVAVDDELGNDAVLIDADALVMFAGDFLPKATREAALELDTAPSNASTDLGSPAAPVEAALVSLFQTNSVGVSLTRRYGFTELRDCCVVISNVAAVWGTGPTSPPA